MRRVAASIDKSSLGRGWHDYFSTGDYSELHGVQRNRLDNLSSQLGGEFSVEDLAIINKYYDFQLPQGVGDNAFTGIGIQRWNSGAMVDPSDQRILNKFTKNVADFNNSKVTLEDVLNHNQVKGIETIATDSTGKILKGGIPEETWDKIYDKIGIQGGAVDFGAVSQ
ncbi:hypothetical protein [Listeria grandensis]|uniref:hypothetical protein n=1 Tax=Listeria grandensis TaxID=1494963 RepID=UPI00164DCE85|nr:hypothetical protein [Listeria grandensis]MBC6314283.1 hypothetical protein [Listeria grandensis]